MQATAQASTETATRLAILREIRKYLEQVEDRDGIIDVRKAPPRTARWYFAAAAQHAYWGISDAACVRARVVHIADAREHITRGSMLQDFNPEVDAASVQNWAALASSYLVSDIANMVKPAYRRMV
jgi:hypothetical protein